MISIVISLGGFGELLRRKVDGKLLFEFARKENLQRLISEGMWGRLYLGTLPEKGYFNFWHGQADLFPGESYLRCLSRDIPVRSTSSLFLGKFITQDRGIVTNPHLSLSSQESELLFRFICEESGVAFTWHCQENEAIISLSGFFPRVEFPPPGSLAGQRYAPFLPQGRVYSPLVEIINFSATSLECHPVNLVRKDLQEPLANLLWLWGMGREKQSICWPENVFACFSSQSERFGGLALFLGFEPRREVSFGRKSGSLWWIDYTLVPEQNPAAWVKCLEFLDAEMLGPLLRAVQSENWKLLVIFDSFLRTDEPLVDPWGIFLAVTSQGRPQLRRYYSRSHDLLRKFLAFS
ncbi:MAG: hypothetical protein NC911_02045 [Candidatus Omnitrophica bacterium]|nr:hypothetical protein [Candidatus Omnitrophota bacterium]